MIRWTGLAPWEFEFPFPGSLTSTFLDGGVQPSKALFSNQSTSLHSKTNQLHCTPVESRNPGCPLSREYGTYKTVKVGFWSWLSGKSLQTLSRGCLFARKRRELYKMQLIAAMDQVYWMQITPQNSSRTKYFCSRFTKVDSTPIRQVILHISNSKG